MVDASLHVQEYSRLKTHNDRYYILITMHTLPSSGNTRTIAHSQHDLFFPQEKTIRLPARKSFSFPALLVRLSQEFPISLENDMLLPAN